MKNMSQALHINNRITNDKVISGTNRNINIKRKMLKI